MSDIRYISSVLENTLLFLVSDCNQYFSSPFFFCHIFKRIAFSILLLIRIKYQVVMVENVINTIIIYLRSYLYDIL